MDITTTIQGITYEINLSTANHSLIIYRDGVWGGSGHWNADRNEIEDCSANFPESVYDELDEAIADALLEG